LDAHLADCLLQFFLKIFFLAVGLWRQNVDEDSPLREVLKYTMVFAWSSFSLWHFYNEYQCLKFTTIPYVQVLGYFQILGLPCGFTVFAGWGFLFSFLQLVGLYTNAHFTAHNLFRGFPRVPDIHLGAGFNATEISEKQAWCMTLSTSVVPPAMRADWKDMVIAVSWLLTTMPEIYSLLRFLPKPATWSSILRQVSVKPFPEGKKDNYELLVGGSTSTGAAVYDMAEGTGMGTIRLQTPSYPNFKANAIFKKIQEDPDKKPSGKEIIRALHHITGVLPRAIRRILLEALAKNWGQANIQISLFAMNRLHHSGRYTWFELISIIVCLVPVFQGVAFSLQVLGITRAALATVKPMIAQMGDETEEEVQKVAKSVRKLNQWACGLILVFIILVVLLTYVVAKLNGALHACPYYLWNVPNCVDLQSEVERMKNCTLA